MTIAASFGTVSQWSAELEFKCGDGARRHCETEGDSLVGRRAAWPRSKGQAASPACFAACLTSRPSDLPSNSASKASPPCSQRIFERARLNGSMGSTDAAVEARIVHWPLPLDSEVWINSAR